MNLTPQELRIVRKLSVPSWPRLTLWCLLAVVTSGAVSLGLAIVGCLKLYHMADDGIQPATISVLSRTWVCVVIGSTALMSSIFIWSTRRYGLLIRKLAEQCND
jgi:hypothetical protein